MTDLKKLRIAVLGAGAVGAYIGGYLTHTGYRVALVDGWPEHVEHINAHGIRLSDPLGSGYPSRGAASASGAGFYPRSRRYCAGMHQIIRHGLEHQNDPAVLTRQRLRGVGAKQHQRG